MDEAEDLVQETFLRLFGCRRTYRPSAAFVTFLYTLARHAWVDGVRKRRRRPEVELRTPDEPAVSGDDPERRDPQPDLREALWSLSEKLRSVVVLSVCQGLKCREVAEVLGVPVGTVKSRRFLALKALREALDVERTVAGGEE